MPVRSGASRGPQVSHRSARAARYPRSASSRPARAESEAESMPAAWLATLLAAASLTLLVLTARIPRSTGAVFGLVLVLQATLQRARPGSVGLWLRVFGLLLAVLGVETVLVISSFHLVGV